MINRLLIENFQCHKKVDLEFLPGVNVIAGTSDSGKSAILKALIWILTNKPQGLGFRNWNAKKGELMQAEIYTGPWLIRRSRSESINQYFLDAEDFFIEHKKFVAMKSDVPADIQNAHDITAINIQTQFQPHFLLASSSGEVTKILNQACDLSIIDNVMKGIGAIYNKAKAEAQIAEKNLIEQQEKAENLAWVHEAQTKLIALEAEQERIDEKEQQYHKLQILCAHLLQIHKDLYTLSEQQHIWDSLPELDSLICGIKEKEQHARNLANLLITLREQEQSMAKIRIIPKEKINRTAAIIETTEELCAYEYALTDFLYRYTELESEIDCAQDYAARCTTEFAELWSQVSECPFCGTEL